MRSSVNTVKYYLLRSTGLLFTIIVLLLFYDHYFYHSQSSNQFYESPLSSSSSYSFPHAEFFTNLFKYYRLIKHLQQQIDIVALSRQTITGNIAWYPSQVYYYARTASHDRVQTICEVGYGAGHSTLLYLMINSHATIYSFDLFPKPHDVRIPETTDRQGIYQNVTLSYIRNEYFPRFHPINGHSNVTIPHFADEHPTVKCDLISIDGSHVTPQVYFDILHFRMLAKDRQTLILFDDVQDEDVKNDVNQAIREHLIEKYECLIPEYHVDWNFRAIDISKKHFCSAHYLFN